MLILLDWLSRNLCYLPGTSDIDIVPETVNKSNMAAAWMDVVRQEGATRNEIAIVMRREHTVSPSDISRVVSIDVNTAGDPIHIDHSSKRIKEKCSWACYFDTNFCKENHVKFAKNYFEKTDPLYFGIIARSFLI